MKNWKSLAFFLLFLFPISDVILAQNSYGTLKGIVVDESNQSPLPMVNVMIEGTSIGTAADLSGKFEIKKVPSGLVTVRVQMMGYEMRVIPNVAITPEKTTYMRIELKPTVLESDSVIVTAGYFHEAKDAVVSNRSMDFEEIRSDPGSAEDVQRVVQALPAVVSGSDKENEIIVRGGMPGENLFIMDNIEIPNPNHFGEQGTGGGPINMVNPYFIRRVDFYAGAFPARYGDKASSVMDISLRDGSRESYMGHFYAGMHGVGAMAEGPIAKGKGSFILSARKSFLDLIISSVGLTAVPKYYSLQGKMSYDISPNNKLIINGIYGNDKIFIEGEKEKGKSGYTPGSENVDARGDQYAFGATLKTLFGKSGFSNLSVFQTEQQWDQFVDDENHNPIYKNLSTEIERALKYDLVWIPSRRWEMSAGIIAKNIDFKHDRWADADTIFVYDLPADTIVSIFRTYPEWQTHYKKSSAKFGSYAQIKFYPFSRLQITAGLRFDYFDLTKKYAIDPRLGLSLELGKGIALNAAVGQQSQSPAYVQISAHPDNKNLDYKFTRQIVVGLEKLFREDMRGTLEFYYKDYRNVAIPVSWLTPDPFDRAEGKMTNKGKGYAKGVEFFLQKKMSNNYYFTISYAYSISKGFDPRFDVYYNWDYDYRHVFTFINGIRFDFRKYDWYAKLKANALYRIFAWALPVSDQMDVSIRWRYLGGRPYTQPIYYPFLHRWVTDETVPQNGNRYPPYHRLDLRIDRRFMFEGWNIVTYFDMMNVYHRDNIWRYSFKEDGTIDKILQWQVMPVLGVAIEF